MLFFSSSLNATAKDAEDVASKNPENRVFDYATVV